MHDQRMISAEEHKSYNPIITAATVGRARPDELIIGPPSKSESKAAPVFGTHATGLS
jgi:hypothetical protein